MDSLTAEMVLLSTKSKDLQSVKKLNCWASDLSDVSLLKEMPNLEILTLSLNNIKTLKDVKYCLNLSELYIRNNKIKDLQEIFYLKNLNNLKILWLEDNPCANTHNYKNNVIKNLPNLEKLDNLVVTKEDVERALEFGEEYTEPPDGSFLDIVTSKSNTELFNSTINETQLQKLIMPISSVSVYEETSESDLPHTSIETRIERDLADTNSVKITTELGILNNSNHSRSSTNYQIENENQKNENVLSAILLLIKNLNDNELDQVINDCQKLKTFGSNC